MIVVIYLVAIVSANLLVSYFGPNSSIYIAFLFIGLDLTLRDSLHKTWEKKNLWVKMCLLIFSGSAISYAINVEVQSIAVASSIAFIAAGFTDTVIYAYLDGYSDKYRINISNIGSSIVDSILFPAIAFGFPLMYKIMLGQIIAKILGGYVWGKILKLWK